MHTYPMQTALHRKEGQTTMSMKDSDGAVITVRVPKGEDAKALKKALRESARQSKCSISRQVFLELAVPRGLYKVPVPHFPWKPQSNK